jgi:RluA family pseudouridine synthase
MPVFANRILYEDPSFLAVSKLSGELVVKGAGAVGKLPLFDFLKKQYPGIHPLNRLDFETSGVVLFARNKTILAQMMKSDKAEWKKTYQAILAGRLNKKGGVIDFPLPSRVKGERVAAQTLYRVLELFPRSTHVEAEIVSGKHHQIRRHFAMIGYPLALDSVYGQKKFNGHFNQAFKYKNFFLHASKLSFRHPVTQEIVTIEAPLPRAFEEVLKKMRDLG